MKNFWEFLMLTIVMISKVEYLWLGAESILTKILQRPIDDPIFRDLANSTTILIEELIKFNIPASNNVKDLRTNSISLSNIISSSSDPTNLSPSLYLKSLGEKAYDVGSQIESIYISGSLTIDELFNELQDIRQNLSRLSKEYPLSTQKNAQHYDMINHILNLITRSSKDPLLTQKDAHYFYSRLDQILNLITRFHDKFVHIEKEIQDIQKLYRGYNNFQGFSNIINYINENESIYKQMFDTKIVKEKLDFERRQMDQLTAIDHEIIRVKESLNLYKNDLVDFIERIIYLNNRKIITHEDDQMLNQVINRVNNAKGTWKEMDDSKNNRMFRIEN